VRGERSLRSYCFAVTPRSFWMLLAVQRPYGATCFARQHCIIEPTHPPPQAGRGGLCWFNNPWFFLYRFLRILRSGENRELHIARRS